MPLAIDLLKPSLSHQKRAHKKKRLVQSPRSKFLDVKCPNPGCFKIQVLFSHSQTVTFCKGCRSMMSNPTGGKARLIEGCKFRIKK